MRMTVRELRDILENHNDDTEVLIEDQECRRSTVVEVYMQGDELVLDVEEEYEDEDS